MSEDMPTAVLTNSQREYLRGENDPSNPREYNRRIRNRIEAGMLDFLILFEQLPEELLRDVFQPMAGEINPYNDAQGRVPTGGVGGIYAPGMVAFLLRGLNYDEEPISPILAKDGKPQPAFEEFIDAIEQGVSDYLSKQTDYQANVTVSIELGEMKHNDEFYEELSESADDPENNN